MKGYLGTNYGHGSAAALVSEQGDLLFAVEEGKLVGQKDAWQFPDASLRLIAEFQDIRITAWAEGWNAWHRLAHKGLLRTLKYGMRDVSYLQNSLKKEWIRYRDGVTRSAQWRQRWGRIDFVGHHLAHAYSLVATGLPPNSLILVSDTTAERNSISTYFFTGRDMVHLSSSPFPHSVGSVFHQLAHHLGFRGRTGPGKLMALSAFGEPRYLTELQAICKVEKGVFEIDLGIFPAWMRDGSWPVFARSRSPEFRDVIRLSQRSFEGGKDIAASAQAWFTETTWKIIVQSAELLRTRYGASVKHVGLAGGAALNCQANGDFRDLIEQCGLGSLIVSPWSDDSGTAIGAAIWAFAKRGTPVDCIRHSDAFLGPLATASQQSRNGYFGIRSAASVLAEGRTVALVSGRSEFGPRALGGRCVLADPRREEARRHLNRMKGRPEFMPIAPAVLKSDFGKYFEGIGSPHMAWTVKARTRSHSEIPAAVHRNGTARVQVVDETASPLLANLLREFQLKTGHPVLLLTSLNGAGEAAPIFLDKAREVAEGLGVDGVLTDSEWLPVRVQDTA